MFVWQISHNTAVKFIVVTKLKMPQNANLYLCLVGDRFQHALNRPFLLTPGREPLLYAELDKCTSRMQSRLEMLGVNPGDRVIAQVDKSPEAVILYLACLRAGAVYIPLNTAYTVNEVGYFMADAQPQVFVCQPERVAALQPIATKQSVAHILTLGVAGEGSLLEAMDTLEAHPDVVVRDDSDLAAILYTSGTTGRSKGAMLTHQNLRSNAEVLHDYWHWQDGVDVLLHALPIFHVHGLFVALHCALLGASSVHFLPKFDPGDIMQCIPDSTVLMGVPTFYTRLLGEAEFDAELCRNMRLFISGSAPLLAETHRLFAERIGQQILERYGMTEAGMIASNPYDGERIAGTVGYPLPGVRARIADDQGDILPTGETGVLEIAGPNVFKGYWQRLEKTAAEFRADGWFITGDLATMHDDGRIEIVGRAKDLIISGGYNVYPKEVEMVIDELVGVQESAVIGVPHEDLGEAVVAVVVLLSGQHVVSDHIRKGLQDQLARFKQPKQVHFVDELPRNTMGKVQKNQLREKYRNAFAKR